MQTLGMTATVRFRGIQPGTAGPDIDPISYLDFSHEASRVAILVRSANSTLLLTHRLSDIISLDPTNTLGLAQAAACQKVHNHEAASTLAMVTEAIAAGGQQLYARIEEVFYVDAPIKAANSVTVQQGPPIEGSEIVLVNGNQQTRGVTEDYTITGSTIVFNASWVLELDDKITIKYLRIV